MPHNDAVWHYVGGRENCLEGYISFANSSSSIYLFYLFDIVIAVFCPGQKIKYLVTV